MMNSKYANGTKIRYEGIYNSTIKSCPLCPMNINTIFANHVQDLFTSMQANGDSNSKIINTSKLLSNIFKYAEGAQLCKNPMPAVSTPANKQVGAKTIQVFSDDQIKRILNAAKKTNHYLLVALAVGTGLRESQLLALQYKDIIDGHIEVYKQLGYGIIE